MQNSRKPKISFLFKTILCGLFLSVVIALISLQVQINNKTDENNKLKIIISNRELKNGQMKEQIRAGLTMDIVERIASEECDMIKPGTIVYRDISEY